MKNANHPENQKPNGPHDLGQISIKGKATRHNPKPWVIVENPSTDYESIVIDFATYREACNWIDRNYTDDDCPADIMHRLDNGILTTEY